MKNFLIGMLLLVLMPLAGFEAVDARHLGSIEDTDDSGGRGNPIEVKNYIQWWPRLATPWLYEESVIGGVSFANYNRKNDFGQLQADFNEMIAVNKPHMVIVLLEATLIQPLLALTGSGGSLPEGDAPLSDVVGSELEMAYVDDLISLINEHDIEYVLYFTISGYGGAAAYPYTYYSRVGWFWQRPDWLNGVADPRTDAMRHPAPHQNGSGYDWLEHTVWYEIPDGFPAWSHWDRTTDGVEGDQVWQVFESPDMVFNGYDTVLHSGSPGNQLNIHTPVPSLSSQAYRDHLRQIYQQVASHFAATAARKPMAYFLFQEPSYALLRENMCIEDGGTGGTGAGSAELYDVDYSAVELARYNQWRNKRGQGPVSEIPFPTSSNYRAFREENLASFLSELASAIRGGDAEANVLLSLTEESHLCGLGTNREVLLSNVAAEAVIVEPPHRIDDLLDNAAKRNVLVADLAEHSEARTFVSYYTGAAERDQVHANAFAARGFSGFYAPSIQQHRPDGDAYPLWSQGGCTGGCVLRYEEPGWLPITFSGRVTHELDRNQGIAGVRVGVKDGADWWWTTETDSEGYFSLRASSRREVFAVRAGAAVPGGTGSFYSTDIHVPGICQNGYEACRFDAVAGSTLGQLDFVKPPPPPPPAPADFSIDSTASQAELSWRSVPGAVYYQVERCEGEGCTSFARVKMTTATEWTDSFAPGAIYRYRLRAFNGSFSPWTYILETAVTWTIHARPTCPDGSLASGSAYSVRAVWPPNPLDWTLEYDAGVHTINVVMGNNWSSLYVYMYAEGAVMPPLGQPPHPGIVYADFFNPQTWMAQMRNNPGRPPLLPAGEYTVRYEAPASRCN